MLIHHYDPETKAYTGAYPARPDPLEYAKLVDSELARRLAAKNAAVKDLRESLPLTDDEKTSNLPPPVTFLIPKFATADAPPPAPNGEQAYWDDGWKLRPIPAQEPPLAQGGE